MKEDFLHYVWQFKLFDVVGLITTSGDLLTVLHPGTHNTDSGPDFFNSKLVLENTVWAGNVEIHWHASEWIRHGHQHDAAYGNVILHVVYEEDETVYNNQGEKIPTLELKNRIPTMLTQRYQSFLTGRKWIPCAHLLHEVTPAVIYPFLQRLMVEKLEEKSALILRDWEHNHRNWEQTFYEFMARNFGFSVNALPFQLLAQSLPVQVLARHKDRLDQLEALLFGQAGLLEDDFTDAYPLQLKKEYGHLKKKYQLQPLNGSVWKFSRMRPANFPTLRIAQFALLVHQSSSLFSRLMETTSLKSMRTILELELSGYWPDHYAFDKPSVHRAKSLGDVSIDTILINTVIPFLFVYGKYKDEEAYQQRAMHYLEQIGPEKNQVITRWEESGVKVYHASDTQGLLHLKKRYCSVKKCLTCTIGNSILKR